MKKFLLTFTLLFSLTITAREPEEYQSNPSNNEQRFRVNNSDVAIELPQYIFDYTNTRITVKFLNPQHQALSLNNNLLSFIVNGQPMLVKFDDNGVGYFYYTFKDKKNLLILFEDVNYMVQVSVISIWYIIAPLGVLLMFFAYKIVSTSKKSSKLTIAYNHTLEEESEQEDVYDSKLHVVRVREKEEVF